MKFHGSKGGSLLLVVLAFGLLTVATPFIADAAVTNAPIIPDQNSFSGPSVVPTGDGPIGTAVGDLDGDGLPDLAVVSGYDHTLSIYSHASFDGTNPVFSKRQDFATGAGGFNVVLADLNGDGKLDAIVVNLEANSLSIYRNVSTPGQIDFAPRIDLTTGLSPHHIGVADLDGDGRLDIVSANYYSSDISVFRNNTESAEAITFENAVTIPAGEGPHGLGIGDLDGDGKPDVIVAHHSTGSSPTLVFRNTSQPGHIDATSLTVAAHLPGDGTFVAVQDLDGDGKADLVVPSWYFKHVAVYRNLSELDHLDDTTFAAPIILSSPGSVKRCAIADLDGDGIPDIAFPTELDSAVSFYQNVGGGAPLGTNSFGPRVDLAAGWNGDGISVADLDLDGKLDIIFCNAYDDNLFIYRNIIGPPVAPTITEQPQSRTATLGSTVTLSVSATGSAPLSYQWHFDGAELPGATSASLVLSHLQTANAGSYTITVSNAAGSVESDAAILTLVDPPPRPIAISSFDPQSGPIGSSVTISGVGFDSGDGETIVYFGTVPGVITSSSATSITATVPLGATFAPITVIANGLTAQSASPFQVTFTSGPLDASAFSGPATLHPGDGPIATVVADFDGDGKPDLAVANFYANNVAVYRNLQDGQLSLSNALADPVNFPAGNLPWDLITADVNGDGKLDLISANIGANTVSIMLNLSTAGNISFADPVSVDVGTNPHQVAAGDIDGDGRIDLLTANYEAGTVSLLHNASNGSNVLFDPHVDFATGFGAHGVGVADLDGDGKLDVVVARHVTTSPSSVVLRNTSQVGQIDSGSLTVAAHLPGTGTYVAFGDLDADGRPEIIIPSWYSPQVSIFKNLSSSGDLQDSSFGSPIILSSPGGAKRVAVTDLNGDGRLDIAFPTELNSALCFYGNLGGTGALSAAWFEPRVDLPAGWNGDGISIGDLDLDGKPELIFCNFYDDTVFIYRNVAAPAAPPLIVSSPQSQTVLAGMSVTFSVEASGSAPLSFQWALNGRDLAGATGSTFTISSASPADAGDYTVRVENHGGTSTSAAATLTVTVQRTLTLGDAASVDEGQLISVPLSLISEGDVGGLDFVLEYDSDQLAAPEVLWDDSLNGALKEFNVLTPGQLRGSLALPATSIPAGTQLLAIVQFRARTVLSNAAVEIRVGILDISDDAGDPILFGSAVSDGHAGIFDTGAMPGDNNGNHHIDVGDASLVMRLIAQLDSIRPWDISGNDLNQNQHLDSGDVIKILRMIAGIDAPPPAALANPLDLSAAAGSGEGAALSPLRTQATAGQLVTIQLRLNSNVGRISGASFRLSYPVPALRLQSAQSHRVGPSVPGTAVAVWNVSPSQNNYKTQNGQISLALSGPTSWNASDTVLAEFTFEVQPGATNQYQWPISISSLEITGNGYNNRVLAVPGAVFIGRNSVAGRLFNLSMMPWGISLLSTGDPGADYRLEVSEDLSHWSLLRDISNHPGAIMIDDPGSVGREHRFYRSIPLP